MESFSNASAAIWPHAAFPSPAPTPAPVMTAATPHNIHVGNLLLALQRLDIGKTFVFESEHHGDRHALFKFRREDGTSIAVRLQHWRPVPVDREVIMNAVRLEVFAMKKLEIIGFRFAPKCLAWEANFDNPLQYPFLVVSWTDGQPLVWKHSQPDDEMRRRLLNQLFDLHMELIDNSLESREQTATQFYTQRILGNILSAPEGLQGMGGMPTKDDGWNQYAHLDYVLGSAHGENTYALAHNNITPDNIIVDEDFNIEGIIGWSSAYMVPLCQAAILPRFLAPDIYVRDMEGSWLARERVKDKERYIYQLSLYNVSLTPAKAAMKLWQSEYDAEFRALYLLSIRRRDIHAWLALCNWKPLECPHSAQIPIPHLPHQMENGRLFLPRTDQFAQRYSR